MARKPETRTYAQKRAKAPNAAHHLLTPSAYSTSPKGRGPWTVLSTNRVPRVDLRKRVAELPTGNTVGARASRWHEAQHVRWGYRHPNPNTWVKAINRKLARLGTPYTAVTTIDLNAAEDHRVNVLGLQATYAVLGYQAWLARRQDLRDTFLASKVVETIGGFITAGRKDLAAGVAVPALSFYSSAELSDGPNPDANELVELASQKLEGALNDATVEKVARWIASFREPPEAPATSAGGAQPSPTGLKGGWGKMAVYTPAFNEKVIGAEGPKHYATETPTGDAHYTHRWRPWEGSFSVFRALKRKRKAPPFGAVLCDLSGSMHVTEKQIEEILDASPFTTLAVYGGYGARGTLAILARNGQMRRMSRKELHAVGVGSGNIVDGPALEWLNKQPGPRVWVCDGGVTGCNDSSEHADHHEIQTLLAKGRVKQVPSLDEFVDELRRMRR